MRQLIGLAAFASVPAVLAACASDLSVRGSDFAIELPLRPGEAIEIVPTFRRFDVALENRGPGRILLQVLGQSGRPTSEVVLERDGTWALRGSYVRRLVLRAQDEEHATLAATLHHARIVGRP